MALTKKYDDDDDDDDDMCYFLQLLVTHWQINNCIVETRRFEIIARKE